MKNDILNKIPKSYDELNYQTWITLIQTMPAQQPENMPDDEWGDWIRFHYLSVLTGLPKKQLYALGMVEIDKMTKRIAFMNKEPKGSKNTLKIKTAEQWTYDNYVTYKKCAVDSYSNALTIFKALVLDKTDEELKQLSVNQMFEVFFSLERLTKKYSLRFQVYLMRIVIVAMVKVIKMKIVNRWKTIFRMKDKAQ